MSLTTSKNRKPDDKKLRELILFIAEKSEGDPPFGATKLNKLLFYADFCAYLSFGSAITWHRYQKLPNGPAPRAFLPIAEKMVADGDIIFADRIYFGRKQKRALALREPFLSVFSAEEINLVMSIIREFWGRSASEMSESSHCFLGWQVAGDQEDIPYEVALIGRQDPSPEVLAKGLSLQEAARDFLPRHAR